jgi:hypothetical protein
MTAADARDRRALAARGARAAGWYLGLAITDVVLVAALRSLPPVHLRQAWERGDLPTVLFSALGLVAAALAAHITLVSTLALLAALTRSSLLSRVAAQLATAPLRRLLHQVVGVGLAASVTSGVLLTGTTMAGAQVPSTDHVTMHVVPDDGPTTTTAAATSAGSGGAPPVTIRMGVVPDPPPPSNDPAASTSATTEPASTNEPAPTAGPASSTTPSAPTTTATGPPVAPTGAGATTGASPTSTSPTSTSPASTTPTPDADPGTPPSAPAPAAAPSASPPGGTAATAGSASGADAAVTTWRIAPGDHLWHVAAATLARAWGRPPTDDEIVPYWRALIDANASRLAVPGNADLVYPGQVFTLPTVPPVP